MITTKPTFEGLLREKSNSVNTAGNFSLHHRVQNVSGAHPASYPKGTGDSFPGDKTVGA